MSVRGIDDDDGDGGGVAGMIKDAALLKKGWEGGQRAERDQRQPKLSSNHHKQTL
jgi:hypothetical protein